MFRGRYASIVACVCVCAGVAAVTSCDRPADSGLLIANVRIFDGSGTASFDGSVRVVDGRIVAVGDGADAESDVVFHGRGLVLAPGFIDTHSHADSGIFEHPEALAAVSQGITTVVVGQDGSSVYPLAEFVAALSASPPAVNVASYVGHNTLRDLVLAEDFRRAATNDEIVRMRALLQDELATGALGLSTGLEYEPGIYSERGEVLALAQLASAAGGRLVSHIRSEDRALDGALGEIIHIGRVTGMPVKISHFKLAMKSQWGRAGQLLDRLDSARADGVDITADLYPYEYWQSTMMVLLPDRDPTDREAVEFALDELAPPDGIWFTRFDPQPEYVGMRLSDIAALREVDPVTAFMALAEQALEMAAETGAGVESIIGTSMSDRDIRSILAWTHTNVATDGGLDDRHPRATGAFPRVLGRYVGGADGIDLATAIRKMSGLAADHMGFANRGYVRPGQAADLVLFDPATTIDRSTPEQPELLAEGIAAVWVNGELVFANGRATGSRPGVFVTR